MSPLNFNPNPILYHIFTVIICLSLLFWHPQQRERRISHWRRPPPPPRRLARTPLLAPSTLWVSPRPTPRQRLCPRSTPESPPQQVSHSHKHANTRMDRLHVKTDIPLHAYYYICANTPFLCPHMCLPGAVQSYTWSLTYTVTTAGGSTPEGGQQLPCMRNSTPVPPPSSTHRMPVYTHREEHG